MTGVVFITIYLFQVLSLRSKYVEMLFLGNAETVGTIWQTTPRGQKNKQIFIEEKELAKLHIAVINQARRSRPVWIIS